MLFVPLYVYGCASGVYYVRLCCVYLCVYGCASGGTMSAWEKTTGEVFDGLTDGLFVVDASLLSIYILFLCILQYPSVLSLSLSSYLSFSILSTV